MGIFFGWIILSFFVAILGSDRKIGYGGTLLVSLLLSPLIGAIFALASERKVNTREMYKCPYCAEYIKKEAMICKHCHSSLGNNEKLDIENFRR